MSAFALLALLAGSHPIHSSSAVLSFPPGTPRAAVAIRVFADDFPPGSARPAVEHYLAERFRLLDGKGAIVPLHVDGIVADGLVLVLTLSAPIPDGLPGGKVWHGVLAEKFSDQVNLVQVRRGGGSATLLFIAGDGAKPLP